MMHILFFIFIIYSLYNLTSLKYAVIEFVDREKNLKSIINYFITGNHSPIIVYRDHEFIVFAPRYISSHSVVINLRRRTVTGPKWILKQFEKKFNGEEFIIKAIMDLS